MSKVTKKGNENGQLLFEFKSSHFELLNEKLVWHRKHIKVMIYMLR